MLPTHAICMCGICHGHPRRRPCRNEKAAAAAVFAEDLRHDAQVVRKAVSLKGCALRFAASPLRRDTQANTNDVTDRAWSSLRFKWTKTPFESIHKIVTLCNCRTSVSSRLLPAANSVVSLEDQSTDVYMDL